MLQIINNAELGLRDWPISELKNPSHRARVHSKQQIEKIQASISAFGFLGSLLIEDDGTIIAGVARVEAAKRLGMSSLPVLVANNLSSAQIKAYRLADNRLAEMASWDEEELKLELSNILDLDIDFDLEVTGFESAQIDLLLDPAADPSSATDDALPPREHDPISQLGDIWELGPHLLFCGDAKSEESYTKLLGDGLVAMVITDPPWNVQINGHVGNSGQTQHREFVEASGEMSDAEFSSFLQTVIGRIAEAADDGALVYLFIDWRSIDKVLVAGQVLGLSLLNIIVWNKKNAGMGSLYRSQHELICLFKKGGGRHCNNIKLGATGRYRTNVWDYAGANSFGAGRMDQLKAHPTAKPVIMIADAIKDVTKRGDIVLDPFCGSGTTLLAAHKTGRVARCMELDPLYVDVAVRRFEDRFDIKAIHLQSGLSFAELKKQRQETEQVREDADVTHQSRSEPVHREEKSARHAGPRIRQRSRVGYVTKPQIQRKAS